MTTELHTDQTTAPALAPLSRRHRTKIIATLGPASSSPLVLKALILAGVNVFRLNLSHGIWEQHEANINLIRQTASELDLPVAILADLQGPKLRTGPLKDGQPVLLEHHQTVTLTSIVRECSPGIIGTKYAELISSLEPGALVLIDDGKIRLRVIEVIDPQTVRCEVIQGGLLEARKGINVPGTTIPIPALTEKDKADACQAFKAGVDYFALSFVQRAQDIIDLRELIGDEGSTPVPIIAKIEKPQALKQIDAILREADGLMVARGDLGVELSPEQVPLAQKELVQKANRSEKPVIIATQMLESMIHSLQPSRSDVSDIANAVFDQADALMLSGETAVGENPVEAVSMMRRIIEEVEGSLYDHMGKPAELRLDESLIVSPNFYHAIAHTAGYAARKADVCAIVALSNSGSMAQRISKLKPDQPIIALTPNANVYNRLSLLWGITPLVVSLGKDTDELLENGEKTILAHQLLKKGDAIVFCAGNTNLKGATNMLKIYPLGQTTV